MQRDSQGSDNADGSEGDEMDEGDRFFDAKDKDLQNAKDSDDDANDLDKDESMSPEDPFADKLEEDAGKTQVSGSTNPGSNMGGANKRKRSHPQYVSAGRHLDRTQLGRKQVMENGPDADEEEGKGGNGGMNGEEKGADIEMDTSEVESAVKSLTGTEEDLSGEAQL